MIKRLFGRHMDGGIYYDRAGVGVNVIRPSRLVQIHVAGRGGEARPLGK